MHRRTPAVSWFDRLRTARRNPDATVAVSAVRARRERR